MGSRGPLPKRSQERRRRNKASTDKVSVTGRVSVPTPDKQWHPIAASWYRSLRKSGQSAFYEPSDWQMAKYVAEAMSRSLGEGRFSAQLFQAVMAGMTELLTSEGARRRLRIEIERELGDAPPAPNVSVMDEYRDAFGG